MYEDKTFENILSDLLSYVNENYPEIDTRIGSVMYTALAPTAMELETAYREMDFVEQETFIDTASKDYLIKHGSQVGVDINEATYGHFKGEFDVDVAIGSRFNLSEFNYNVISKISNSTADHPYYTFELVCETAGAEPNNYLGDLTPITFIANLSHAKLISVISYGEDEEDTEEYRYRIQTHIKKPPINGNVYQYNEWLDEYDGVGKYKVIPCWNGVNTVKLTILNSNDERADSSFIEQVQNYFDPPTSTINDTLTASDYPQGRGMGNGKAPIGAIVTVDTAVEVPVKIEATLKLKDGYSSPVGVESAVDKYLTELIFEKNIVAYMPISAELYNAESVSDVVSLKITVKGTVMDASSTTFVNSVSIESNEIPVLDTVNSVWSVQNG